MVVKERKKFFLVLTLLVISSMLITSTMNTLATEPNEVDVTIICYKLQNLHQDSDTFSAGDIYFKISHSTTQTSGVATNDYEDNAGIHDLDNDDFDGDGYYNKEYNNIRLNTGLLDWVIYIYDADSGDDELLFQAQLTVKDADTTGEREYDDVWCMAQIVLGEIYETNYWNSYLEMDWQAGMKKNDIYNGILLWIILDYHT